eukprot:TRINITY_DN1159_c0_g1_i18.p1 TRINITY_DN1159_c0_g1~~TRINITY_DN1159_c0_g1_i18.p1  ORF type:complete len:415 (-),score=157.63 TRINITY_DN1159_c0_g1_i18:1562-2806(-)
MMRRAGGAKKKDAEIVGLGLPLVKHLLTMFGASVLQIESVKNRGTRCWFDVEVERVDDGQGSSSGATVSIPKPEDLLVGHVLVIEPSELAAEPLVHYGRQHNMKVTHIDSTVKLNAYLQSIERRVKQGKDLQVTHCILNLATPEFDLGVMLHHPAVQCPMILLTVDQEMHLMRDQIPESKGKLRYDLLSVPVKRNDMMQLLNESLSLSEGFGEGISPIKARTTWDAEGEEDNEEEEDDEEEVDDEDEEEEEEEGGPSSEMTAQQKQEREEAATKLQSVFRGHQTRAVQRRKQMEEKRAKEQKEQEEAAVLIQSHVRAMQGRKEAARVAREQKEQEQREVAQRLDQERAAILIQSQVRRMQAQREVAEMRKEKEEEEAEDNEEEEEKEEEKEDNEEEEEKEEEKEKEGEAEEKEK